MANEVALINDKELQAAFGAVGFGEFRKEVTFPYLSIAAKTSDRAVEGSATYIEGLKPGYLFNSISSRVYGNKIRVIILDYSAQFREHTKNDKGGKGDFVRIVPPAEIRTFTQDQIRDYTKNGFPNGNLLEEVKMFYVVLPDFKEDGIMKWSFPKGSFKHIRNWGGMIVRTGEPYPAHIWEVATGMMKNEIASWFTIGNDDTTFVKDCGAVPKELLLGDVKEAFDLVQAIRKSENNAPVIKHDAGGDEVPF